ncbi:SEFIR domain-containing protein [Amycolatopsis pittospori]|uniref:SEFIR domain-containing protein n=1 Tax=Amycolatopsis pittospori TaxID=2749434 RepID=UPI0015EFE1AF|nr:SEFIR domain-containing protein [Amycolatopsis pittospori]
MDPGETSPRVYISYSRDSDEHTRLVLEFSGLLRSEAGIDAHLDRWYDDGRRDWTAWVLDQVGQADFILAIASPEYKKAVDGRASSTSAGLAEIEGALIRNSYGRNVDGATRRILPVILPGGTTDEIPDLLRPASATNYVVPELTLEGIRSLARVFYGSPAYPLPSQGSFLPPVTMPDRIFVSVAEAPPLRAPSLTAGVEAEIGEDRYLVHGDFLVKRTIADGAAVERRARALRVGPPHEQVWLRQVEVRQRTPRAKAAIMSLGREHDLLAALDGKGSGMPSLIGRSSDGGVGTLITRWPTDRSSGRPCDTLAAFLPEPGEFVDPLRALGLLRDLARLCRTLARLHGVRRAHRLLEPDGILRFDDGTLVLRDLGLAAVEYEPGEAEGYHQAPEQRRRSSGRVGPWTDVYQVAAMAYHLTTGHPPRSPVPLPVSALAPGLPPDAAAAIDAALRPEPALRPDIRVLATALAG